MNQAEDLRRDAVVPIAPHLSEVSRFIAEEEPDKGFDPVGLVLRAMRGRWLLASGLATVLAGLAGTAGYLATTPDYESRAIIRVSAREPSILYASGDDSRLKLFNAFVKGEATFVASRPVMERAAARLAEEPAFRDEPPTALGVGHATEVRRTDSLIVVTGTADSGPQAAAVVNAVVDAYRTLHRENDERRAGYRESELAARERDLFHQLSTINARMLAVGAEYGAASLAKAHIAKIGQIETLEGRRNEVRGALAAIESKGAEVDVDTGDALIKRAVLLDRGLADLSFDKARREAELAALLVRYEEKHQPVVAKRAELAVLDEAIERRRGQIATLARTGALTNAEANDSQTADEVRRLLDKVEADLEEARVAARALNEKRIELAFLEEERHEVRRMLDETRRALDMVRVESRNALPGIIEVMSDGAVAEKPADDKRLILAGIGAMGGGGLGFFLLLAPGLLSPRMRYSDEFARPGERGAPIAVFPRERRRKRAAGEGAAGFEADRAARANGIRNAIQLWPVRESQPGGRGRVLAVAGGDAASPAQVARAIAESFGRAGLDTILVDADLAAAQNDRTRGDEDGFATLALAGGGELPPTAAVAPGVRFVPAGGARGEVPGDLSLASIRAAVARLAACAEVVVLDVGGRGNILLRDLVATEADLAVVVARRGEPRAAARRTLRRMEELGRNGAALVFADARRNDPGLRA